MIGHTSFNAEMIGYTSFNQRGDISTQNGSSLKLVINSPAFEATSKKVKLATLVDGDPMASFSIATTPRF